MKVSATALSLNWYVSRMNPDFSFGALVNAEQCVVTRMPAWFMNRCRLEIRLRSQPFVSRRGELVMAQPVNSSPASSARLAKFSGIPSQDLTAAAFWILTSWFPDVLPVLPTLIVASPSSGEARKFFRILRCFCRRGVLLTELGPNGFLSLPMFLRPTLIVEQANLDRRMRGLFRAAAGMYVASGGEFLDLRCARAVFCEQDDLDADLHDGCLRVSLFPPATAVPAFDKSDEEKLAAEFLPRLLRFRCNNFRRVSDSVFDAPAFTTGIRDVARSLGACVVGDPKLEAGIIELLSSQDTDLRASFATRPDVAIIIAMLALLHERTEDKISVTKFTTFANAALRASGEIREYSPLRSGGAFPG